MITQLNRQRLKKNLSNIPVDMDYTATKGYSTQPEPITDDKEAP